MRRYCVRLELARDGRRYGCLQANWPVTSARAAEVLRGWLRQISV
jgi:hypothetical protein